MADEIDIIFKSINPATADPTVVREVTFDVKHNSDNEIIGSNQTVRGEATDNKLYKSAQNKARELYREYEAQKVWLGYSLPKTFTIDA